MSQAELTSPSDSADHWLAYRYLTGDLDAAEWSAVEARLAEDLSLQTALSEMVSLTVGLSQFKQPMTDVRVSVAQPVRRMTVLPVGIAAAAVLLLAVGLTLRTPGSDADDLNAQAVMTLWSDLGTIGNGSTLSASLSDDNAHHVSVYGDSVRDDSVLDIPDWLLLAVADEAAEGDVSSEPL